MSRKTLKQWLVNANGWQRIWFVSSVVFFLHFIIIYPLMEADKGRLFRYEMRWAAEKEMKNPICASYMSEEFGKLAEPMYSTDGSSCYHIYSHRRYSSSQKPITKNMYEDYFSVNEREIWLEYMGLGFMLASLLSGFLYFLGLVVSWVIKGFKKSESQ